MSLLEETETAVRLVIKFQFSGVAYHKEFRFGLLFLFLTGMYQSSDSGDVGQLAS